MPRRPRPRSFGSVLAALVLVAGCGEEEDLSPNYEDRIPAGLTLAQGDRSLAWRSRTNLSGRYDRDGDGLGGEAITLQQDLYPFEGEYEATASTTSDERGRFSFEVEPALNTAYRVTAGETAETQSKAARVTVLPRISVKREPRADGAVRYTTTVRYAPEVLLAASLVRHYAADAATAAQTGRLRLVDTTPLRRVRPGLSRANYELPPWAADYRYESCASFGPASGVGAAGSGCAGESLRIPSGA